MTMSDQSQPGGLRITNFITPATTPAEFDAECTKCPGYTLTAGGRCGWTALGAAANKGNVLLVEHIVRIGGKTLLELRNESGFTPLYCATEAGQFRAAKALLDLGAQVDAEGVGGETSLRTAALAQCRAVTKLLLIHQAKVPADLNEETAHFVADIQAELCAEKASISVVVADVLPVVLAPVCAAYVEALPQPEEAAPEPEQITEEEPALSPKEAPEGISCSSCTLM